MRNQEQFAAMMRSRGFRDLRFRMNNYFEYNRQGRVREHELSGETPWDDAFWDPSKALAPYDPPQRPRVWTDLYNPFQNDDEAVRAQQAANMQPFTRPSPDFIRPPSGDGGRSDLARCTRIKPIAPGRDAQYTEGDADGSEDAAVIAFRDRIRARGLDIRSLRHVGSGASSLATLFESLKRAVHVLKILEWETDIFAGAPLSGNARSFAREMDSRQDLTYLEFMKAGNLTDLIGKSVAAGAAFPNGVLWKVFFCRKRICDSV
ncbi:hypothetical protein KVR01_006376 [Diaporthe batatas]|uniref:uncharacterized protein n=1 Tax=Diaporthe batatas TaxID=748121 RepID=UPI001D04D074|nr:uncharacterized protein KVR01_006376 [Diaporthe batatas]KAG8164458.1 hypothetical protein KVR01_006376 [Diaporthe batatas]